MPRERVGVNEYPRRQERRKQDDRLGVPDVVGPAEHHEEGGDVDEQGQLGHQEFRAAQVAASTRASP